MLDAASVVSVTGWALDAATVFDLIVADDDKGLRKLLLNGDDNVSLSNKKDRFDGGNGNDVLDGLKGDDVLSGGKGNDTLLGGLGNDELTGGSGRDSFVFKTALNADKNVDTITDFEEGRDTIIIDDAIFVGAGTAGNTLSGNRFALDAAADGNDRIVYVQATGEILYDADGNGAGAAVLFARVEIGTVLGAGDFLIG